MAIAWTAYAISTSLPAWSIESARLTDLRYTYRVDLLRCLWAVLLPTISRAPSFPLAIAAIAPGRDPARAVGRLYAANTFGAISGRGAGLWLIPAIGTQLSQRVLLVLPALAAACLLAPLCRHRRFPDTLCAGWRGWASVGCAGVAGDGVVILRAGQYDALPWKLACLGATCLDDPSFTNYYAVPLYVGEGLNSTVALVDLGDGYIQFHVSGKVEASSLPQDMRMERMLGHFPALFHKDPRDVLVVGCGAGVTAGSFLRHPGLSR